jgi:hypothetical protein
MRLDKFTKVLLNLVLVLLVALLLKSLIGVPKEIYAQGGNVYKVSIIEQEVEMIMKDVGSRKLDSRWWEKMSPGEQWSYVFNWNAGRGWKFHSFIAFDEELLLIFEK